MVIIGYQGIGKSTLAGVDKFIDLESGNFWYYNNDQIRVRDDHWYKIYCNIAIDLSQQGFNVFVSSHKEVRDTLMKNYPDKTMAIVPSIDLKDAWIDKLEKRYRHSNLTKDYKAWKNAEDRYEDNIKEIIDSIPNTIILDNMNYDLRYI